MSDKLNIPPRSMPIVSIYDRKARSYTGITPVPSIDVGKRYYCDLLRFGDSIVIKHPEDFDLYWLGFFDPDLGRITAFENPEFVCNNSEVPLEPKQEEN